MTNVAILTLPLGENYGGILQAYALQRVIRNMGHDVETSWSEGPTWRYALKRLPGLHKLVRTLKHDSRLQESDVSEYTSLFVARHIKTVPYWKLLLKSVSRRYGTFVVGSDQVWRREYAYIPHYLLNFAPGKSNKISYAASFGKDDLSEYDDNLVRTSRCLARRFDHISVREDSGVNIVRESWGLEAEHHLDPTMLLSAEDYDNLLRSPETKISDSHGELFSYILDQSQEKNEVVDAVAERCGLDPFSIVSGDRNNGSSLPPVSQWLKSFIDAKYVVTDSFHGTVFSILFNKPFLVVGNVDRGLSRLTSLLRTFNLQDRFITSVESVTGELILRKCDWDRINKSVDLERARATGYLGTVLTE